MVNLKNKIKQVKPVKVVNYNINVANCKVPSFEVALHIKGIFAQISSLLEGL